MWFAMRTAVLAPVGLLTAKNNSNIGEFRQFLNVRLVGATLANTDSSRSR